MFDNNRCNCRKMDTTGVNVNRWLEANIVYKATVIAQNERFEYIGAAWTNLKTRIGIINIHLITQV